MTAATTNQPLRSRANQRLLILANGINSAGEMMTATALTVKLFGDSQSFVIVATLMGCTTLPLVLWSGRAGHLVDSGRPKRIACRSLGALAIVLAALAAAPASLPSILALVVLASSLYTFADSAIFALIPHATGDGTERRTVQANMNAVRWIGSSAGALAAGFADEISYRLPLAIDALTYVVAMLLISRMIVRETAPADDEDGGAGQASRWQLLRRYPRVIISMSILIASIAFLGTTSVLMIGFVLKTLHGDASVYGTLQALYMAGIMAGTLAVRVLARRLRPMATLITVCGLSGCFLILQALIARRSATVVLYTASGVAHGADSLSMRTQLTEEAPDEILGRLFSVFYAAAAAADLVSFVLGAVLGELLPVRTALAVSGAGTVLVIATALTFMPLANHRSPAPKPA